MLRSVNLYLIFLIIMLCAESVISQTISLHQKDIKIRHILREITKQTGYSIFYADSKIDQNRKLNVDFERTPLKQVLDYAFKDEPVLYTIANESILFQRKNTLVSAATAPLSYTIKGKVLDEDKNPLWGAAIKLKNTNTITYSKQNGEFILKTNIKDGILFISYIGYETQHLRPEQLNEFVILKRSDSKLDEVQIIAYGKNTKRYNLGNINTITSNEIERQPVVNVLQTLQGSVPGLSVNQVNGFSSASIEASIRGKNNLSNVLNSYETLVSEPLYVVDGVPVSISNGDPVNQGIIRNRLYKPAGGQSPLYGINPADIENISILKDADATAIYGSRAANGVILITTKSGQSSVSEIHAKISAGMSLQIRKLNLMNRKQYLDMREAAFKNDGIRQTNDNAPDLRLWDQNRDVDWQREILGPSSVKDVQFGLSGGQNLVYRINSSLHNDNLPFPVNFFEKRNTLSLSLKYEPIGKKLDLKFQSNYARIKSELPSDDPIKLIFLSPNAPPIFNDNNDLNTKGWSPLRLPEPTQFLRQYYKANTNYLTSNLNVNYKIWPKLMFNVSLGYSLTNQMQNSLLYNPELKPLNEKNMSGHNKTQIWIAEPNISYKFSARRNTFEMLLGATLENSKQIGEEYNPDNYNSKLEYYTPNIYNALFLRSKYDFAKKYLIAITGRLDGSSGSIAKNQVGKFGSVAAGWIISEENFFKQYSSPISFLKLRSSYGITGQNDLANVAINPTSLIYGLPYQGVNSLFIKYPSNKDLSMVFNKRFEMAMDIGVFNDRLLMSFAIYKNKINNHITYILLPAFTGTKNGLINTAANVLNQGMEFMIQSTNVSNNFFSWKSSLNISTNRNRLSSYKGNIINIFPFVGQSIDLKRMYHYIGIDRQTGEYQFEKEIVNGVSRPKYIYKDVSPRFTGSLQNSLIYKNVSLNFLLTFGVQSGMTPNSYNIPGNQTNGLNNALTNSSVPYTTKYREDIFNFFNSDAFWVNASYMRLQNISLAYSLPIRKLRPLTVSSCDLFLQAQNLFTITKYKGFDALKPTNQISYPIRKVITLGLQLTF